MVKFQGKWSLKGLEIEEGHESGLASLSEEGEDEFDG